MPGSRVGILRVIDNGMTMAGSVRADRMLERMLCRAGRSIDDAMMLKQVEVDVGWEYERARRKWCPQLHSANVRIRLRCFIDRLCDGQMLV